MKALRDRFRRQAQGQGRKVRWRAPGLLVAIALAYGGAATALPAEASPDDLGATAGPPAHFVLSITPQPIFDWEDARATSDRVVLACNPDAGTHPNPRQACEALREVGGSFERLSPPDDYVCTLEYAPVRVEAIGYWGERPVDYSEVFSNRCFAAVGTNFVFQF